MPRRIRHCFLNCSFCVSFCASYPPPTDPQSFSANADMRNKKFASNVYSENYFNILKTLGIYGPNNAGKTCLVKCIRSAKNILLNREPKLMENIFQESSICEMGISFLEDGREFSYDFWYDTKKAEYWADRKDFGKGFYMAVSNKSGNWNDA